MNIYNHVKNTNHTLVFILSLSSIAAFILNTESLILSVVLCFIMTSSTLIFYAQFILSSFRESVHIAVEHAIAEFTSNKE